MSPLILFGLPGAGKSFLGELFHHSFDYYYHDGDRDIPVDMRKKIDNALPIDDTMRDRYFEILIQHIHTLSSQHKRLVISQTFIKEKYRTRLRMVIPNAQFILVHAEEQIRESRLKARTEFPLDISYVKKMTTLFEKPELEHKTVQNNFEGTKHLLDQIAFLNILES